MDKITRLKQLVAEVLKVPPDEISADSGLQVTPGWDSMAHVSILVAIEREFGIEVNEELMNCRTVGELAEKLPD